MDRDREIHYLQQTIQALRKENNTYKVHCRDLRTDNKNYKQLYQNAERDLKNFRNLKTQADQTIADNLRLRKENLKLREKSTVESSKDYQNMTKMQRHRIRKKLEKHFTRSLEVHI